MKPSQAVFLNKTAENFFAIYPNEKVVAVAEDGHTFFADGNTPHGQKDYAESQKHANRGKLVVLVTKGTPVVADEKEPEPVAAPVKKKGKLDPAAGTAIENKAIEDAIKPIYTALNSKDTAAGLKAAVALYAKLTDVQKKFLTPDVNATLATASTKK